MNNNRSALRLVLISVFGLAVILTSSVSESQPGSAVGIPVSEMMLQGQLTLWNGETVEFAVREGMLLTVQPGDSDVIYGFLPKLAGGIENRELSWEPLEIRRMDVGGDEVVGTVAPRHTRTLEAETFQIEPGRRVDILVHGIALVPLRNPEIKPFMNPIDIAQLMEEQRCGRCCVTCPDGSTVCAASVKRWCGKCTANCAE